MTKSLDFRAVIEFLKQDDHKLVDATDQLLGVAIICLPIAFGPAALPALGLLRVKGELTALGKNLLKKISSRKEADYLARMRRMEIAYGLICYTAFFEAIDRTLPKKVRSLLKEEELRKHIEVTSSSQCEDKEQLACAGAFDEPLRFPHPAVSFEDLKTSLIPLYEQLSIGLRELLTKLMVASRSSEEELAAAVANLNQLPAAANEVFEAQYFELARIHEDFLLWSDLLERKTTQKNLDSVSLYVRGHQELLADTKKQIDVGFRHLSTMIDGIPANFKAVEAAEVVAGLRRNYQARLSDPIIDDTLENGKGEVALRFPKIADAFIPQAYSVLTGAQDAKHLEQEETWNKLARRNDLGSFFLRYLSSPFSHEAPLLILGHPGSGKSLLTKVLCARLMSEYYTPIRVPLREVDGDAPIEAQIEAEILRVTGNRITSWANFSSQFAERPLVVVLDGYDELLQASGRVHSGYLNLVRQFQQREIEQGRPVRLIVTSRITLIDKATVPEGTTVMRLLEFDERQRDTWTDPWNSTNISFFAKPEHRTKLFKLPKDEKILALAEQPLLLLMLALFDSDQNALRKHRQLDRSVLYDSLLRRFIRREKRKAAQFLEKTGDEQAKLIDHEMRRLGVAAIGMYNRRKLHIPANELGYDLGFFDLESKVEVKSGRAIEPADELLGSFFFVHKSQARHGREEGDATKESAFEFLHNTFGEFLAADFILQEAFLATESIQDMKNVESLRFDLRRKLSEPGGLRKEWFACLAYAPLFSRPVVLEMIREWGRHAAPKGRRRSWGDFLACFDDIMHSQIAMVLDGRLLPAIRRSDDHAQFGDLALLGHLALYTLNLFLLRASLEDREFIFDEKLFVSDADSTGNSGFDPAVDVRPWDRLLYLWRSWFTVDSLNGLSAVLEAKRNGTIVSLKCLGTPLTSAGTLRLEKIVSVALALSDEPMVGLAGLHSRELGRVKGLQLDDLAERLHQEDVHVRLEVLVRRFRRLLDDKTIASEEVDSIVNGGLRLALEQDEGVDARRAFWHLLLEALHAGLLTDSGAEAALNLLIKPMVLAEAARTAPGAARELLRIARGANLRRASRLHLRHFERMLRTMFTSPAGQPDVLMELLHALGSRPADARITEKRIRSIAKNMLRQMESVDIGAIDAEMALAALRIRRVVAAETRKVPAGLGEVKNFCQTRFFAELAAKRCELAFEWLDLSLKLNKGPSARALAEGLVASEDFDNALSSMINFDPGFFVKTFLALEAWLSAKTFAHSAETFFRRLFRSAVLVHLNETSPREVRALLLLLGRMDGSHWFEVMHEEAAILGMFRSPHFEYLMFRQPGLAVCWIEFAFDYGYSRRAEYGRFPDLMTLCSNGLLKPERFLSLVAEQPEAAVDTLRLVARMGAKQQLREVFGRILDSVKPDVVSALMKTSDNAALSLVRLLRLGARATESKALGRANMGVFKLRDEIGQIPVDYFVDVKWYASLIGDSATVQRLEKYVADLA